MIPALSPMGRCSEGHARSISTRSPGPGALDPTRSTVFSSTTMNTGSSG